MLIRFQRKVHQTRKEYLQKETIRSQGKMSEIKNLTSLKKIQGKNYKIKLKKTLQSKAQRSRFRKWERQNETVQGAGH